MSEENNVTMDKILALSKGRGFVFAGSEIYGGLANSWDYGPLGVELKKNIMNAWWKRFVQQSPYNVGLDSGIILNTKVWEASGHLGGFSDPLMDCKACKSRYRADKLIEDQMTKEGVEFATADGMPEEEMMTYIKDKDIVCPKCGAKDFTDIRKFNLMFKTSIGVTDESSEPVYLRPETAQGIFINFKNVARSSRKKIPFGIAQIGKAFRNEITPRNFIFRTPEFEQMELQFFCKPGTDMEWFEFWRTFVKDFLIELGLKEENLRARDHGQDELSFYSKGTTDYEYRFPFGWGELWGVANRTDYDLTQHMNHSREDLNYQDPVTNEKYVPYVIEPSVSPNRIFLAALLDAYEEQELENGDVRKVLHLHPYLAPYKVAVLPLSKKLNEKAEAVYAQLAEDFMTDFDDAGSIGKRYRREDEIGTPFCVTIDFDTLEDEAVTIRDRDTMEQVRVKIAELNDWVAQRVKF